MFCFVKGHVYSLKKERKKERRKKDSSFFMCFRGYEINHLIVNNLKIKDFFLILLMPDLQDHLLTCRKDHDYDYEAM